MRDDDRSRPDTDLRNELLRLDLHDVRADEPKRAQDRAVLVLRGEDLLLGPDPQRADDRIQRGGRVRREHEVVGAGTDEGGQRAARLAQRLLEPPSEELRRLALEVTLEPLVLVEHLHGARAEAPVIEVRDLRIEEKARTHAWLVSHGARASPTYFPPLPRSVLTLQVGGLVSSFGNGMVIPFMSSNSQRRGIGLGVTGLIVATRARPPPLEREGTAATIENMALTKDDPLSTHAEPPSHPSFARPWWHAGHRSGAGRPRALR